MAEKTEKTENVPLFRKQLAPATPESMASANLSTLIGTWTIGSVKAGTNVNFWLQVPRTRGQRSEVRGQRVFARDMNRLPYTYLTNYGADVGYAENIESFHGSQNRPRRNETARTGIWSSSCSIRHSFSHSVSISISISPPNSGCLLQLRFLDSSCLNVEQSGGHELQLPPAPPPP
jgi:hypothetical protein